MTTKLLRAMGAMAFALFTFPASAQQAAHDNWTYYGVQFSSPTATNNLASIAISSTGVYVGENTPNAVTKVLQFTETGVFVRRFSATFGNIRGLACDAAGNVYVVDVGDSKVKVFDANGGFLREWGGVGSANGQFSFTNDSPSMISVDRNDQVYVADPGNTRVQVFDANGAFLRKWGQLGALPGQFVAGSPTIVIASNSGFFYAGLYGSQAKMFFADGNFASTHSPSGVYAASSDGLVLWYDGTTANNRKISDLSGNLNTAPTANSGSVPSSFDAAFSKRGDLYCISGTKVSVFKREYSSSKNFLSTTGIPQPVVLSSTQRTGTSLLDIDYQVTDADSPTVTTGLLAFKKSTQYPYYGSTLGDAIVMSTFIEGTAANVGANQPSNTSRHVTWNMPADWAVDYADVQVEVLARDSRNLLGIHWITVPASGGSSPVAVSSATIDDGQLLDLWFWFLATHQECTLTRGTNLYGPTGTVYGTSGVYTGQKLATSTNEVYSTNVFRVTPAGRLFVYEKMGIRGINGNELARAQAGNYGFTSLDAKTTAVKETVVATSYVKGSGINTYGLANWLPFSGANPVEISANAYLPTGIQHALILRADGTVWAVGANSHGQLGDGTTVNRLGPVLVASGVAHVATGALHSLFLKTDGTLWATGNNGSGELGDGTTVPRTSPVQVATNVAQIAAGWDHSAFIKTDGTLWTMGYNAYGQLGDGTNISRSTPVQIATGVGQVSAGARHTMFVKPGGVTTGTLWATGDNSFGKLGTGGGSTTTPALVTSGVSKVACGEESNYFIKTDGTLWGIGFNGSGQLGDGTTISRSTPVQIATNVASVSAGSYHVMFLKNDNTLWAIGANYYGQLGDGTTTDRTTPTQVGSGVSAFAAGRDNSFVIVVP